MIRFSYKGIAPAVNSHRGVIGIGLGGPPTCNSLHQSSIPRQVLFPSAHVRITGSCAVASGNPG